MGYEIAEQCGWTFPDAIIYPTGGGTGVVGIWKAVKELEALGWTDGKRPRFFSVQAEGCQPIVRAFERGDDHAEPWPAPHTVAHGMRVPSPLADYLVLRVLRESNGGAIAVSDDDLLGTHASGCPYRGHRRRPGRRRPLPQPPATSSPAVPCQLRIACCYSIRDRD